MQFWFDLPVDIVDLGREADLVSVQKVPELLEVLLGRHDLGTEAGLSVFPEVVDHGVKLKSPQEASIPLW